MIAEALLLVTGSGALAFWLGVLRGRKAQKTPTVKPPKPPVCSCTHGYGTHDGEGCHGENNVTLFKDQLVESEYDEHEVERLHWSEIRKCPCRRFDSEIPAYLFGVNP